MWKWASCKRRGEPKSKEQRREEGRGVSSGRGGLQVGDSESGGGQRRQEWGGVSGGASHGKTQQVHVYSRAGIYSRFNNISLQSRFIATMLRITEGPADTVHRKRSSLFG